MFRFKDIYAYYFWLIYKGAFQTLFITEGGDVYKKNDKKWLEGQYVRPIKWFHPITFFYAFS